MRYANVRIPYMLAVAAILTLFGGIAIAQQPGGSKTAKQVSPAAESRPLNLGDLEESEAALDADVAKDAKQKDDSLLVTLGSFVFKLAVVIGLAYASIYALKHFTGLRNAVGSSRRRIKVIDNANIGTNRSVHLIEVGAKRLLVGSTPNQISLLAEIGPEEAESEQSALVTDGTDSSQPEGFAGHLASMMSPDPGGGAAQVIRGTSAFLQEKIIQLGRLRRMLRDG